MSKKKLSEVGLFMDARMKELGIRQIKDLAQMTGISASGLSRMRNDNISIQEGNIKKLAKALQCDEWDIRVLTPERRPPNRRREGIPQEHKKTMTICWGCRNAVPDAEGKRGCSWSRKLEPVEGWQAVESTVVRYDGGHRREIMSALVLECPQYKPDEKPKAQPFLEQAKFEPKEPEWKGKVHFEDDADLWTMLMSEWGI